MYLSNAQGDYRTGMSKIMLNPVSLIQQANGRYTGIGYSASFASHYADADQNIGAFLNTQYFVTDWFSIVPELALFYNLSGADGKAQGYSVVAGLVAVLSF